MSGTATRYCPWCRSAVTAADGHCLLGHRLPTARATPERRRPLLSAMGGAIVALVFYVALLSVVLSYAQRSGPDLTTSRIPSSVDVGVTDSTAARGNSNPDFRPKVPTVVAIPRLGLVADIEPVGLTPSRELEVPDPNIVGWYEKGTRPGVVGPAVLIGHVDSLTGPGIFNEIPSLFPGDLIVVEDRAGFARTFEVSRILRVDKDRFPTALVYDQTRGSELRLITCGGRFDFDSGHYTGNVIVFARSVGPCKGDTPCTLKTGRAE
jgi:hypothetical protein